MAVWENVVWWALKKRVRQLELTKEYPHEIQSDWFRKLIAAGVETQYGEKFDFKAIRTVEDFSKAVPLNDYDSLKPWINRIRDGESKVLWNSEIKWFAKSSGTTSDKSKFIPMSKECLEECHYNGGKDMISIYYALYPDAALHKGKSIGMGGSKRSTSFSNTSSTFQDGDLSAIIMDNLPIWANLKRTPDLSIALMDEWEEKIEKMASITAQEDVRSIAGVPSWTLLLLKRVLEITKKSNISEVWPNLEVFFHGGVNFDPYIDQYKEMIPSVKMRYFETYNASEGFFGIQDTTDDRAMLLMLDYGIFYEFVPITEMGKESPQVVQLEEVELGINYAMVITTNAGLWRYIIGDTVMFTSRTPYRIIITGRVKNFINLAGEELIIDNAEKALAITCHKTNAAIKEYTAGPVYSEGDNPACHEWIIEFEKEPEDFDFFSDVFDTALKSQNSDYEAKRYHDMILAPPKIIKADDGLFYAWMKQRGKLGGQHKVPRLANNRKHIDSLLALIREFESGV